MMGTWRSSNCIHAYSSRIVECSTSEGSERNQKNHRSTNVYSGAKRRFADHGSWTQRLSFQMADRTRAHLFLSFLIGACQDLVRPTRPKALQACRSSEEGPHSRSPTSPASPTRCPSSHSAIQHQGQARPRFHSFRVEAGWCRQEGGQGFGYRHRPQEEPKVRGEREGQRREAQGVQEPIDRLPEEGRQGQEGRLLGAHHIRN